MNYKQLATMVKRSRRQWQAQFPRTRDGFEALVHRLLCISPRLPTGEGLFFTEDCLTFAWLFCRPKNSRYRNPFRSSRSVWVVPNLSKTVHESPLHLVGYATHPLHASKWGDGYDFETENKNEFLRCLLLAWRGIAFQEGFAKGVQTLSNQITGEKTC